ncbi:uncharacterized protein DSM5745_10153 [Aspergillus mulundensis]|uniref:Uncharacterized protein n=1 Tax=Aspergillus mulundensis TaxID=1810919 RepID=A0A3D8QMM1_9EURO|nr:hypothetical protein DSM5745_10153 [Aspergillus mulundensis]RDW63042.1 hypothetical protein DSM5745_10153 [Aspergillus mulundensis]
MAATKTPCSFLPTPTAYIPELHGSPATIPAYSDCDSYCLPQGQSVGDLARCLVEGSAEPAQVRYNVDVDAGATSINSLIISSGASAAKTSSEGPSTPTAMPATETGDVQSKFTEKEMETELETRMNGGEMQINSVSVTTAILLALMVFGGAVRPPAVP